MSNKGDKKHTNDVTLEDIFRKVDDLYKRSTINEDAKTILETAKLKWDSTD